MTTTETVKGAKKGKKQNEDRATLVEGGSDRDKLTGIYLARIDPKWMRESAARIGVPFTTDSTDKEVALGLLSALGKLSGLRSGKTVYECTPDDGGCGGGTNEETGRCPFCGRDEDAVADPKPSEVPVSQEEQTATVIKLSARKGDAGDVSAHSAPKAGDESDKPPEDPKREEATPPPVAVAPANGLTRVKPKGRSSVKPPEEANAMPVPGSSTGLAKVVPSEMLVHDDTVPASQVLTEADLDAAEQKLRAAQHDTNMSWWREGMLLYDICMGRKLWALRRAPGSKEPLYKSVQEYITKGIGLTVSYVWKRLDWARAYSSLSEKQAAEIGKTNLQLISYAPKEDQPRLLQDALDKINKGERVKTADTRAAKNEANAKKGAADVRLPSGKEIQRPSAGASRPGRKKEFVKLAIASQLTKSRVAFYESGGEGEKPKRLELPANVAKWFERVAATAYAEHESLDGEVTERFSFHVKDGKLSLAIDRTRAGEE